MHTYLNNFTMLMDIQIKLLLSEKFPKRPEQGNKGNRIMLEYFRICLTTYCPFSLILSILVLYYMHVIRV